jgi:hypothetical protein
MARGRISGWVEQGGNEVTTDGRDSTTLVQKSFPGATVTVFNAGTVVLATIFSTEGGVPLANPFIADDDGFWGFWTDVGRYDVQFSGAGIETPFTIFALEAVLSGEGIVDPGTNGYLVRTAVNTAVTRTLTGTANRIVIVNGDGQGGNSVFDIGSTVATSGNNLSFFSATTSAQLAAVITNETGTGVLVFNVSPALTTPAITGGTHIAITSLGIRSTGTGAFDLTFANTENLTAGRTLTFTLNNVNRTISLNGNLTTANSFTTAGNNALTLTTTAGTNVTLPVTGTLATLAGTETLTNKTLTSPRVGTAILDTNGNEIVRTPATGSAVNDVTVTNAITGGTPSISASGDDPNVNLRVAGKGTGRVIIPGYAYALDVTSNVVGNVTGGLDALNSFTIVADTLAANNDFIEFAYGGRFATNDNQKRIVLTIDGQTIYDSSLFDFDGVGAANQWSLYGNIIRISATSVIISGTIMLGELFVDGTPSLGGNALIRGLNVTLTVSNLDTLPVILLLSAESAGPPGPVDNDITKTNSVIKVTQRT